MAGFLDYGSGKGLTVAHDWAKDTQNLFQTEALKARAQQEKEQKTAFFANQLQEGKAVAPANTKRLQDFYLTHNKKVADFVIKNPNFETDVTKMTEFMSLTDQYINNDIIREDQQVQEEFAKLKGAINNGKLRDHEQFAEMQKYNDYKDGKTDEPYIFIEPQRADIEKTIADINKNLPTSTYTVQNKDGSENQIRKVKFNQGENWSTLAESRLASDPEIKWQIETGYKSSKLIQDMYPKGPAEFLAARLEQAADSYNVQSNIGTSNKTYPYPNYKDDLFKPLQNADPEAEYQVLTPANPNLIVLTSGGKAKGPIPIRAGGEYFDVVTGKNDANGVPAISKINVRHNMTVLQTYSLVNVKGQKKIQSYVNIEVPLGDEQLTDRGRSEYYDVDRATIISKDALYGLSPSDKENKEWAKRISDNKKAAATVAMNFQAAGLRPANTATQGGMAAMGAPTLKGMRQYEGMVLLDAHFDEPSVRAYQERFNTPTRMDEWGGAFNIVNMLTENLQNPEAFIALSKQNANEAAQVITDEISRMPGIAKQEVIATQVPGKEWIYKTTSAKGDMYYNIRTRKFEKVKPI